MQLTRVVGSIYNSIRIVSSHVRKTPQWEALVAGLGSYLDRVLRVPLQEWYSVIDLCSRPIYNIFGRWRKEKGSPTK